MLGWDRFTARARALIELAGSDAEGLQQDLSSEHILLAIVEDKTCAGSDILDRLGVDRAALATTVHCRQHADILRMEISLADQPVRRLRRDTEGGD